MSVAMMTMPVSIPPGRDDDWITLAEAARVLDRHVNAVKSIALTGLIKTALASRLADPVFGVRRSQIGLDEAQAPLIRPSVTDCPPAHQEQPSR